MIYFHSRNYSLVPSSGFDLPIRHRSARSHPHIVNPFSRGITHQYLFRFLRLKKVPCLLCRSQSGSFSHWRERKHSSSFRFTPLSFDPIPSPSEQHHVPVPESHIGDPGGLRIRIAHRQSQLGNDQEIDKDYKACHERLSSTLGFTQACLCGGRRFCVRTARVDPRVQTVRRGINA